jgi:hypothetical protein
LWSQFISCGPMTRCARVWPLALIIELRLLAWSVNRKDVAGNCGVLTVLSRRLARYHHGVARSVVVGEASRCIQRAGGSILNKQLRTADKGW